jgi:uncharacterized protein DUF6538
MRSWPMLMQRGSTWYFRRIVPLALRPLMEGKREIWRSLRTSDFNEAKLLSLREGQEVERLFQSLRQQGERAHVDLIRFRGYPLSWISHGWAGEELPRCRRAVGRTHRSSGSASSGRTHEEPFRVHSSTMTSCDCASRAGSRPRSGRICAGAPVERTRGRIPDA